MRKPALISLKKPRLWCFGSGNLELSSSNSSCLEVYVQGLYTPLRHSLRLHLSLPVASPPQLVVLSHHPGANPRELHHMDCPPLRPAAHLPASPPAVIALGVKNSHFSPPSLPRAPEHSPPSLLGRLACVGPPALRRVCAAAVCVCGWGAVGVAVVVVAASGMVC